MKKVILLLIGAISLGIFSYSLLGESWRTARRDSANIAPNPEQTNQAVVQVYGAKAFSWRGWVAIHTWIATKKTGDKTYKVYDVVGWRGHHGHQGSGNSVMRIAPDIPDRYWFGAKPTVLKEHKGDGVDRLIDAIDVAAKAYPWQTEYKIYPGPNSNTFIAWIAKSVPALELTLPWRAIGKGYVD